MEITLSTNQLRKAFCGKADLVLWIGLASTLSEICFSAACCPYSSFSEHNFHAQSFSEVVFKNVIQASLPFMRL